MKQVLKRLLIAILTGALIGALAGVVLGGIHLHHLLDGAFFGGAIGAFFGLRTLVIRRSAAESGVAFWANKIEL